MDTKKPLHAGQVIGMDIYQTACGIEFSTR